MKAVYIYSVVLFMFVYGNVNATLQLFNSIQNELQNFGCQLQGASQKLLPHIQVGGPNPCVQRNTNLNNGWDPGNNNNIFKFGFNSNDAGGFNRQPNGAKIDDLLGWHFTNNVEPKDIFSKTPAGNIPIYHGNTNGNRGSSSTVNTNNRNQGSTTDTNAYPLPNTNNGQQKPNNNEVNRDPYSYPRPNKNDQMYPNNQKPNNGQNENFNNIFNNAPGHQDRNPIQNNGLSSTDNNRGQIGGQNQPQATTEKQDSGSQKPTTNANYYPNLLDIAGIKPNSQNSLGRPTDSNSQTNQNKAQDPNSNNYFPNSRLPPSESVNEINGANENKPKTEKSTINNAPDGKNVQNFDIRANHNIDQTSTLRTVFSSSTLNAVVFPDSLPSDLDDPKRDKNSAIVFPTTNDNDPLGRRLLKLNNTNINQQEKPILIGQTTTTAKSVESRKPTIKKSTESNFSKRRKNNEDYSDETEDKEKKHESSDETIEATTHAHDGRTFPPVSDGKRILSNVKANCAEGFIADRKNICREKY